MSLVRSTRSRPCASEREQAYTQIHKLAGQVEHLQRDLAQVRKQIERGGPGLVPAPRPAGRADPRPRRGAGGAILAAANEEIEARRAAAEHIIEEAREQAAGR